MKDRYLFKAKRIKDGQWVEGAFYIEPYTDACYIIQWNSSGLGFNEFIVLRKKDGCISISLKKQLMLATVKLSATFLTIPN